MTNTNSPSSPLVSLLITARNDGYMGDFLWRLETTLNCLAHCANVLNRLDDFECVVCDWGSDEPIHQVLHLIPEAQRITKFVVVPPEVAKQYQADSKFPDSIAFNVAARRASGRFLGLTGSDILYTVPALRTMCSVLDGEYPEVNPDKSVLIAGRRHVPVGVIQRQPPLPVFLDYVSRNAFYFPADTSGIGTGAPTNLIMLHRDIWHACQGIDQRLIHWGWNDTDLVLRGTQQYPLVNMDHFGVNILHMEHWTKPRQYLAGTMFRQMNKADDAPKFVANDANWGLANLDLAVVRASGKTPADRPVEKIPTWPTTIPQIAEEVNASQVKDLINLLQSNLKGMIPPNEEGVLSLLAWYATTRSPMNFVEVGMRYPYTAALVSRAWPGVEMFPLVRWERNLEDEAMFSNDPQSCLTYWFNNILRQFSHHWAHTQFIGGDFETSVARLKAIQSSNFVIDLALLRPSPFAIQHGLEVAEMLSPGGGMVVIAANPDAYAYTLGTIQQKFPQYSYLHLGDRITGIVLAAKVGDAT